MTAEEPNVPAVSGAREALVEQLAEAMFGQPVTDRDRAFASNALPLVAAEVEAAVSVVRAERDEEVERLKRGRRELGRILHRALNDALDASGRHDAIDEDGDGDWGVVWETLAELRPRAESAESDLQALREGLEAEADALDELAAELPTEASGLRLGARSLRALLAPSPAELSDPTTDGVAP